jgi:hypothetical protein
MAPRLLDLVAFQCVEDVAQCLRVRPIGATNECQLEWCSKNLEEVCKLLDLQLADAGANLLEASSSEVSCDRNQQEST